MSTLPARRRSLTGIQPSGMPHLGNLLGAIRPALKLAETHDGFYFVASYHALTTQRDPELMARQVWDVAATWLSFGLDPERCVLWNQHEVPEVCELSWVLACMTPKSGLDKAHAYKDAVTKGIKEVNCGLYTYPILMAADILAFDSHVVPVGKDQKQHVEMARDMAQRLNHHYGEVLVVPEPQITPEVAAVPGIDGQKMSKSYGNDIGALLPSKKLRKRVMRIATDSKPLEAPKDPDTCTVFALYKLFATPAQREEMAARYRAGGLGYGHAKQELFELMDAQLAEPRERHAHYIDHPDEVREILASGALKARPVARATLSRVRDAIGLSSQLSIS